MPVGYTDIVGKFTRAVVDGPDSDRDPDRIPVEGLQFEFVVDLKPAIARDTVAKETVYLEPIPATTDENGILIGPDGLPGIRLTASDSPDLEPNGWTYTVTTKGAGLPTLKTTFVTESGKTLDFSEIIAVPPNPGNQIPAWTAVVSQATTAAAEANEAKTVAVAAAESVQRDEPNGVAPLDGSKKIPEPNLPSRLSEAGLSATFARKVRHVLGAAGQSNIPGRDTTGFTPDTDPALDRVKQFGAKTATITAGVDPLDNNETTAGGLGPVVATARNLLADGLFGTDDVLLVSGARGGTSIAATSGTTWNPNVSGSLLDQFIAQLTASKVAVEATGERWKLEAILWSHGETDGDMGTTGAAYKTLWDALRAKIRTAVGVPDLLFVVLQMAPDYLGTGTRAEINSTQASTPSYDSRTVFVTMPTGYTLNDGNHVNAAGQRIRGERAAKAIARRMMGLAYTDTAALPAQVTGLAAGAATADSVPLTWNAVSGATGYRPQYRKQGVTAWTSGPVVTAASYTPLGLDAATTYEFRVTATNATGDGTPSATVSKATASAGPLGDIYDTFNRADSASTLGNLDSGQAWVPAVGTWGILSNEAYVAALPSGEALAYVEASDADVTLRVKLPKLGPASHSRLIFRYSDANNFWMLQRRNTGVYQLYKKVAGSFTQVGGDASVTSVAGDVISVDVAGSSITAKINGVTRITGTDTFNQTATKHGLGSTGATPNLTFDDFVIVF